MTEKKERKPGEFWTDDQGHMWSYLRVGWCRLCRDQIYQPIPMNVMVNIDDPFFCETCRKNILKLVRPDLEVKP